MTKWLRTAAPYTLILLLSYALVINFYYFSHPYLPIFAPFADGFLYQPLVQWLQQDLGFTAMGFTILSFILLFIEAIILNALANRFKILQGESFFVAFSFLLFSCLFPEWHVFSSLLLSGVPLLLLIHQSFKLFDAGNGRTPAFNLGLIIGLLSLLYFPALALIVPVWFALAIARPFKLSEWILVILGVLCPWYFLSTYLFLTDQLPLLASLPIPGLSFPSYQYSFRTMIGLPFLLLYFLYGAIRLQRFYANMAIQTRKLWTILIVFVLCAILLPFLPDKFLITGWFLAFFPMAILIAYGFYHTRKNWLSSILHFLILGFVLYLQWFQ